MHHLKTSGSVNASNCEVNQLHGHRVDTSARVDQRSDTRPDQQRSSADQHSDVSVDVAASNIETLSTLALAQRERQRKLDISKARVGILSDVFEQIGDLASQSENSVNWLAEFIESASSSFEKENCQKIEIAKLSTKLLESNHQVESLAKQLQESNALVHSPRKCDPETVTPHELDQNELASIRNKAEKLKEKYNRQGAKLSELNGQNIYLKAKYDSLVKQLDNIKAELKHQTKHKSVHLKRLSETSLQFEEEVQNHKRTAKELHTLKRRFTEMQNNNIDIKSKLESALLKQEDNKKLEERCYDANARLHEIEHLLDSAPRSHEGDYDELPDANTKLRDLILRYESVLDKLNLERMQNQKYAKIMSYIRCAASPTSEDQQNKPRS